MVSDSGAYVILGIRTARTKPKSHRLYADDVKFVTKRCLRFNIPANVYVKSPRFFTWLTDSMTKHVNVAKFGVSI